MVDLSRGLRYVAWADDKMFRALAQLPPQCLDACPAPSSLPVAGLARHIVSGAEWYRYCLIGQDGTEPEVPATREDWESLRQHLAALNALLLEQVALPDERVTYLDDDSPRQVWRSTLLTQAILHSVEHRAQIAIALEAAGVMGFQLDDYDLWAFEAQETMGHT